MVIRRYENKDKENVRFICLNSEGPCDLNKEGQTYILTTYCDYYIEQEPENCFVAADENDRAVGYIICTENYDRFIKVFSERYVSRFDADSYFYQASLHSADLQGKHKATYPAHLHIDVLPEYQRMGLGHCLVDRLCEHLRNKGIHGVMLTVGASNVVGQSFYKKYGFTKIDELSDDVAYGLLF